NSNDVCLPPGNGDHTLTASTYVNRWMGLLYMGCTSFQVCYGIILAGEVDHFINKVVLENKKSFLKAVNADLWLVNRNASLLVILWKIPTAKPEFKPPFREHIKGSHFSRERGW